VDKAHGCRKIPVRRGTKTEEIVMEDDDYFEPNIDAEFIISSVDKNDPESVAAELERIRQVIAHPADYDCGFYFYYEFLAEHFGWKKMSKEKLTIYHELTRFIPLELAGPDILGSFSFDTKELDDYQEAFDFYHFPLNLLLERGTDGWGWLDLWREFFTKHPEELVKELKHEEDFHRENPDYRPRLKEWFYDEK
jgi:hypothetical protein